MSKDIRRFLRPDIIAKAVSQNLPIASPDKFGSLPHHMRPHRNIIPTFMHGKKVTFVDKQSESNNRHRRAVFPNTIYRFVYSRLLDLNIYARMTTTTLYQMERKGGFDEYVLGIGFNRCDDEKAVMYKRLIDKAWAQKGKEMKANDVELLKEYGEEYSTTLQKHNDRFHKLVHQKKGYYL